jgi:hypothetical protein
MIGRLAVVLAVTGATLARSHALLLSPSSSNYFFRLLCHERDALREAKQFFGSRILCSFGCGVKQEPIPAARSVTGLQA